MTIEYLPCGCRREKREPYEPSEQELAQFERIRKLLAKAIKIRRVKVKK